MSREGETAAVPERIVAFENDWEGGWDSCGQWYLPECDDTGGITYVTLAHAEAMVAAERERCAGIARGFPWPNFLPDTGACDLHKRIAEAIMAVEEAGAR